MTTAQKREAERAQAVGDALLDLLTAILLSQDGTVVIADVWLEGAKRHPRIFHVRLDGKQILTLDERTAEEAEKRLSEPPAPRGMLERLRSLGLTSVR